MTYQEKYMELFKSYEQAISDLLKATHKISFPNKVGDLNRLENYLKAHKEYKIIDSSFQQLLNYLSAKTLNSDSEYIECEFMYNSIKEDQKRLGIAWRDEELTPNISRDVKGYECIIKLTNDGEINQLIQGTEYKFPVINLDHGRECYNYLAKMLQYGGDSEREFVNINENKQVYIKVVITFWQ